jgi:hypothetical protein
MTPTEMQMQVEQGLSGALGMGAIIAYLIAWFCLAFCLAKIGQKLGVSFGKGFVMSLLPIVNLIFILQLGRKPWWWLFLFIIPIVNLVILALAWAAIAERRRRPNWWGLLMLVPVVNFVILLMLAFGEEGTEPAPA